MKFIKDICKLRGWPEPNEKGFNKVIELKLRYICVNRAKKGFDDKVEAWAEVNSYRNVLNSISIGEVHGLLKELIIKSGSDKGLIDLALIQLEILKELTDGYKLISN